MFSHLSVSHSVHSGGMYGVCVCVCVCGRGRAWQAVGSMHGVGGGGWHAWQERRPLQRTVRILLECILVVASN